MYLLSLMHEVSKDLARFIIINFLIACSVHAGIVGSSSDFCLPDF